MPIGSAASETDGVPRTSVDADDSDPSGTCAVCGAIEVVLHEDGSDGPFRECINGHQNGRENTGFSIGPLKFEDDSELDEYED